MRSRTPSSSPPSADEESLSRVVFWNRINSDCQGSLPMGCGPTPGQFGWGRVFIWEASDARNPVRSLAITDPGYAQDGSMSLFCGGQLLAEDGHLVLAGGTDRVKQCQEAWELDPDAAPFAACAEGLGIPGWGHEQTFILRTDLDPGLGTGQCSWVPMGSGVESMFRPHWYPTLQQLHDDRIWGFGHAGGPLQNYDIWREELEYTNASGATDPTLAQPVPASLLASVQMELWDPACDFGTGIFGLSDYPRLHLTSGGLLVEVSGIERIPGTGNVPRTRYLDIRNPACDSVEVDQWLMDDVDGNPANLRHGGNSVHIIKPDPDDPTRYIDTIYSIAGSDSGNEALCDFGTNQLVHGTVQKLTLDSDEIVEDMGPGLRRSGTHPSPISSTPATTATRCCCSMAASWSSAVSILWPMRNLRHPTRVTTCSRPST